MGKHSTKKESKNKKTIAVLNGIFLLTILLILFGFCITIFIIGQKDESVLENRALTKFPAFELAKFFNGEYQNNLESALSDQMILGQEIKYQMTSKKAELTSNMQAKLAPLFEDEQEVVAEVDKNTNSVEEPKKEVRNIKYIPISGNVYHYGDSEYMVFKYRQLEKYKDKIDKMAEVYNEHFKDIDSYLYFVNISKGINFNTVDETENDFLTYIKSKFNFTCDGLKISSYEQYMDYFYETDHHWNYKGSYQGYKDIINMLLPGEEVLEPTDTTTFDVYYYGTNARTTAIYTNKEKFTVYDFELPEYDSYVNGYMSSYGNKRMYYNGNYPTERGYNHYGAYYGGDFAQVMYDFNQPEKENLLVIAPSYSNAINDLVASHFNETHYIDLRHYENQFGRKFDPEAYCKKHDIDKFLFLISVDHLTNGNFMLSDI